MTHDLLSDLVAAHRPSVTVALNSLHKAGLADRRDHHWLLHGEPPGDLEEETPPVHPRHVPSFS
jgi:hypothetical protein